MGIYSSGRPTKYRPGPDKGTPPPQSPGEYRIRDFGGEIVYIGETNNLHRRMNEHLRTGKLDGTRSFEYQVADSSSTSETRRLHEREKIGLHNPVLNKSRGGEGRIAGKGKTQ